MNADRSALSFGVKIAPVYAFVVVVVVANKLHIVSFSREWLHEVHTRDEVHIR